MDNLPWIEKYRPNKLIDIISHKEIIDLLINLKNKNKIPNIIFYGPPGTGKTSTIHSYAHEIYGEIYKTMILELNCSDDRGINKFYKDIGVDYNLYPDIPKNSPVNLIALTEMKKEFTEAETKYVVSFVLQKIVKTVTDQMKITVHFVMKNDPLAGEGLFGNIDNVNDSKKVAIEFVFTDGYYTND